MGESLMRFKTISRKRGPFLVSLLVSVALVTALVEPFRVSAHTDEV